MNFDSLCETIHSELAPLPTEEAWAAYEEICQTHGLEVGLTRPERVDSLERLMKLAGCRSYSEVLGWSQSHRAEFWKHSMERLGLSWEGPIELDGATAIQPRRWFPKASWDLVGDVFRLNAPSSRALQVRTESGQTEEQSFAELELRVAQWSFEWSRLGYKAGDALGFCAPMNANSTAAFLGALDCGLVVICIAESFSEAEIQTRLHLGQARGLAFQAETLRSGRRVNIETKARAASHNLGIPSHPLKLTDDVTPHSLKHHRRSSSDPLLLLFSSGTTGEPKVIPWTSLTPIKSAVDAMYHQGLKAGDRVAWPTSWGWMMGPWLLFASFLNRASLVLFDGAPHHEKFLDWIVESQATHLGVVPSLVKAWIHQGQLQKLRHSQLEVLSSTGECSNRKDMFLLSHACGFKPIIEYCGGTEIGGAYIANHRMASNVPSTFSGPTLGLDFVLLDENGKDADSGEVYLVPPSLGLSETLIGRDHHAVYYSKAPAHPRAPLRIHGDEIQRLPSGFYRALGRMDDTMNLGGIKVAAVEIERTLVGLAGLHDVAAVAQNPVGGGPSELVLFAVLDGNTTVEAFHRAAQERIRTRLNPLFKVSRVSKQDSLPRTASNKLMRRLLKPQVT